MQQKQEQHPRPQMKCKIHAILPWNLRKRRVVRISITISYLVKSQLEPGHKWTEVD